MIHIFSSFSFNMLRTPSSPKPLAALQIEKQKQAHQEKMQEIMKMRSDDVDKPKLDTNDFLTKYRQAENEMETRVRNLENMVRDSEAASNKSLANVEKLKKKVSVSPGSRAARALERELKKQPRRSSNDRFPRRSVSIDGRGFERPSKTADGVTVVYYHGSRVRRCAHAFLLAVAGLLSGDVCRVCGQELEY